MRVKPLARTLVAFTALIISSTGVATAAREPAIVVGGGVPQATCVGWCFICDVNENKYLVIPSPIIKNDEDEDVACGHHVPCPADCRVSMRQDVETIVRVVASSNDKALRQLLKEVEGLEYNQDRRALQLEGCNKNDVVLHIPLSPRQVEIASDAANELLRMTSYREISRLQ